MNGQNSSGGWENQLRLLQPTQPTISEAEAMYAMGYAAALAQNKAQQSGSGHSYKVMFAAMLVGMLVAGGGGFWLRDAISSSPSSAIAQGNANARVASAEPNVIAIPAEQPDVRANEVAEKPAEVLPQSSATQWLATAIERWWYPAISSASRRNAVIERDPSDLTVFIDRQHFVHLIMETHAGYRRTSPVARRREGDLKDGDMETVPDWQSREESTQPSYLTPATLGRNSTLWKDWIQ